MPKNHNSRQISVAEMAPHIHSFYSGENKVQKITDWIANWIKTSLKSGKIKHFDFLPAKGDIAFHIGVSKGTMQNAFRLLEDMGLIESKQRIGSYIRPNTPSTIKLTSKREQACAGIKSHIIESNLKSGDTIESLRELSKITELSETTVRIAINTLITEGIIEKVEKKFVIRNIQFKTDNIKKTTLAEKIASEIRKYISSNKVNSCQIPSNPKLAEMYNVSIKTIHDAIKILAKEGLINTRRGKYGTQIITNTQEPERYKYEDVEVKIRHYISKNCKIGDKLPTIKMFAQELDVSTKTIKKAMDNLAEEGYLTFERGRLGGTFVTDIPQTINEAYTWLALNPDFMNEIQN